MDLGDLWKLDATAQAALIRDGEVTPRELLEQAIARIERLNPQINAVITPLYERARTQAHAALESPFAGVPMLVKDASLQIAGTSYCVGTRLLRNLDYRSDHTTELAARFASAGFVVIGKTNVPCMSSGATTEPLAFGPSRNPWDLARTPGGSSGGSAAAVAAGMVPIAHGGDAAGSLRYPAACCGLVTLKPSRGRVPSETPTGDPDDAQFWSEFVLARTVRDLAGVLAAVGEPLSPSAHRLPRALRIGLMLNDAMSGMTVDAWCVAAVERTGALLEAAGHHVAVAHPPSLDGLLVRIFPQLTTIINSSRPLTKRWLESIAGRPLVESDVEPELFAMMEQRASVTTQQEAEARTIVDDAIAAVPDWWASGFDILVTPALRQPPWPLGSGTAFDAGTFPFVFSLTGQPAMSVPMHCSESGLPVGVQLVGPPGGDELLLHVAAQLEQAQPWADRWPSIALG